MKNLILKYSTKTLVLTGFLLLGFSVKAQDVLENYLKIIREKNPDIQIREKQYYSALQGVNQTGYLENPRVSVQAFGPAPQTRTGSQELMLSVSQSFPWKGTLSTQKKIAQKQAEVKESEIAILTNQLIWEFKQNYYPIYKLHRDSLIYKENLEILRVYEKLALQKYEVGKASMVDVIRIQTEIRDAETDLALTPIQKEMYKAKLNELLFRPANEVVMMDDSLPLPSMPYQRQDFLDSAFSNFPQFEIFKRQEALLEVQHKMTYLMNKPEFMAGLNYAAVKRRSTDVPQNGQDILMPMVSVSIPLYQKQYRSQREQIKIEQETLELQKQAVENSIQGQFGQIVSRYRNAQTKIEVFQKQMEDIEKANRIQIRAFASSGEDFVEILRFQQQIFKYRLAINQAYLEQYMAMADLEMLLASDIK